MTISMLKYAYDFCEPYRTKNGEIRFTVLPQGTLRLKNIGLGDVQKDDTLIPFTKYLNMCEAWNLPDEFTKGYLNDGLFHDDTDLRDAFKDVAEKIMNLYDRSVFFIDENDQAINLLFILNSYFRDEIRYAPRIIIEGVTSSGKGRVDSLLTELCYHAIPVGDGSYASSFRMISEFDATPIFSEFGDYGSQDRKQLCQMLKVGFDRNGKLFRCASSNFNNEAQVFNVFTPMSLDVKSIDVLPEDVVNRSFRINMMENIGMKKIDRQYDLKACREIRTELYRLKLLATIRKIRDGDKPELFQLNQFIADSIELLGDVDDDGFIVPAEGSGIRSNIPEFTNRTFDIASAYYPFARMTGTEDNLLTKLQIMQNINRSKLLNTVEAMVFNTWISESLKYYQKTMEQFVTCALKMSTKEIKDILLTNLYNEGNSDERFRNFKTTDVTKALNSIGFVTSYEHMPGHQTYVQRTNNIMRLFLINTKKFCDEETYSRFLSLSFTNDSGTVPDVDNSPAVGKMEA